jgi:hypothetical protein
MAQTLCTVAELNVSIRLLTVIKSKLAGVPLTEQRSATGLDRFPQPPHRECDILRLQLAPAVDLGVVALFRKALEIFRDQTFGGVRSLVNFSRTNGSRGMGLSKCCGRGGAQAFKPAGFCIVELKRPGRTQDTVGDVGGGKQWRRTQGLGQPGGNDSPFEDLPSAR